jgi:hypothetical protein
MTDAAGQQGATVQSRSLRSGKKRKSILWLDNRIRDLFAIVAGLRGIFDVDEAENVDQATSHLQKKRAYHIFLVDFVLEGVTSRSKALVRNILGDYPNANIIFVSGYIRSMPEYRKFREELKLEHPSASVHEIDKSELPIPLDAGFEEFVARLDAIADSSDLALSEFETGSEKGATDYPDFSDFRSLSLKDQSEMILLMYERHADKIESLFLEGNIWIMFCGTWDKPARAAKRFEEMWTEQKIIEFGRFQGYAPICFSRMDVVDDVFENRCSSRRGLDGYPVVRLEKAVPASYFGRPFSVHFDTGNPATMLCDRTYSRAGWWAPASLNTGVMMIGGEKMIARKLECEGVNVTDYSGQVLDIKLTVIAVQEWERYRYAAACAEDCTTRPRPLDGRCVFRSGLLGRSFQRDTKHWLSVDCAKGLVKFGERI